MAAFVVVVVDLRFEVAFLEALLTLLAPLDLILAASPGAS